jgi:hypothetical protein
VPSPAGFNTHQYTLSFGGPIKKNKTFFFVLWDQVLDWQRSNVVSPALTPCARNGIFRFFDSVNNGNAAITNTSTQARSVDINGNPVTTLGPLRYASVYGQLPANLPAANADCSNLAALVPGGASSWDPNRTTFDSTGYVKKLVNTNFMPLPNRFDVGEGLNTAGFHLGSSRSRQWGPGRRVFSGDGPAESAADQRKGRSQLQCPREGGDWLHLRIHLQRRPECSIGIAGVSQQRFGVTGVSTPAGVHRKSDVHLDVQYDERSQIGIAPHCE